MEKNEIFWITNGYEITICNFTRISFQRTARLSEEDQSGATFRSYGAIPVEKTLAESYRENAPICDVILPIRNNVAFWLGITPVNEDRPCALRVRIEQPDDLDAVSGSAWSQTLMSKPQNYIVSPPQRFLKGMRADSDTVKQFVRVGGGPKAVECHRMLLVLIPPKEIESGRTASTPQSPLILHSHSIHDQGSEFTKSRALPSRSVGEMVISDEYGPDFWDHGRAVSVRVALVGDEEYVRITGKTPPGPLDASEIYQGWRLP